MKNGRYKLTPKRFLFMYLVISMILGMYYLCYTGGECLKLILQEADFCFMDFFNHIYYVKEPQCVYDVNFNACFPPLAYMLYWLLSRMIPVDGLAINDASSFTSYGILLFCIYHILMGILFYAVISGLLKSCGEKFCLLFTLLICVSNVFIFSVVWTGNAALLACIVLLKAFELRDREDKWSREFALLLIAAAAGLKIYPALFGIFYLKEKRYREAGRLIIYGIVFFFVPFIFFGGLHGLFQMLKNQQQLHSVVYYGWRNIQAVWNQMDNRFLMMNMPIIGKILAGLYAVIAMTGGWILEDKWKRLFLLCSIMIVVPSWSGSYTIIYLVLPLAYFLSGMREQKTDYVYATLFAMMFSFFVWNTPTITNLTGDLSWVFRYVPVYMMGVMLAVETIITGCRLLLDGKLSRTRP